MKINALILFLLIFNGLLILSSCGKNSSKQIHNSGAIVLIENQSPKANHHLKSISLGHAEDFTLFASTSISSMPYSRITGKVGLAPGVRSKITLLPDEVKGGSSEVYASDDSNHESRSLLKAALDDLIGSSIEFNKIEADVDKVDMVKGFIGGKTFPAGSYLWNSRVAINHDIILDGGGDDVWFFHIRKNFNMDHDIRVLLANGAQAKNIFWMVDGSLKLDEKSELVGTVFVQNIFTMKKYARLQGRAFSLNGNIVLDNNIINNPKQN